MNRRKIFGIFPLVFVAGRDLIDLSRNRTLKPGYFPDCPSTSWRLPELDSWIYVPFTISPKAIEAVVNREVPDALSISERQKIKLRFLPDPTIHIKGVIKRKRILVECRNGKVAITVAINGSGSSPVRWKVAGKAIATSGLKIAKDWRVSFPKLSVGSSFSEAKLVLRLLPDISLREKMTRCADAEGARQAAKIPAKLNGKRLIEKYAQKLWTALHLDQTLDSGGLVSFQNIPEAMILKPVSFDEKQGILGGIGIRGKLGVAFGEDIGSAGKPKKLPSAELLSSPERLSRVRIPARVDLHTLAAELTSRFTGRSLVVGDAELEIGLVELATEGNSLWIRLKASGREKKTGIHFKDQTLVLKSIPSLDAQTRTLSFSNLAYGLETSSQLVNGLAWMAQPVVIKLLREKTEYCYAPQLEEVKRLADGLAADLYKRSASLVSVEFQEIAVDSLSLAPGALVLVASVTGSCDVTIGPLDQPAGIQLKNEPV
ncbi:DUF4403 family protein [Luteolibacter sp. Populi]|uniref:DUF4403 family protein n=1 Tax=Luteolibacter sp. Populi TaxID=3230487 RepID=UPI0034668AE6